MALCPGKVIAKRNLGDHLNDVFKDRQKMKSATPFKVGTILVALALVKQAASKLGKDP